MKEKKIKNGITYVTVSYTHLDVYKRQAVYVGKADILAARIGYLFIQFLDICFFQDVYKRQAMR